MKKKLLAVLLAAVLLISTAPQGYAADIVYSDWSDWSATYPTNLGNGAVIEQKTQYRYKTRSTATSTTSSTMSGYTRYNTTSSTGSWSAWKDSSIATVNNDSLYREVQTQSVVKSYNYGHYCTGNISGAKYQTSYTSNAGNDTFKANCVYHSIGAFTASDSQLVAMNDGTGGYYYYKGGSSSFYRCPNTCYRWYRISTNYKTQYRYRDTTYTYYFEKISDWTSWSDTKPSSYYSLDTRTVYRYKTVVYDESTHVHSYSRIASKEATCIDAGYNTYICTDANCDTDNEGHSYTEIIPAKGHTWDDDYTIDKEATCVVQGSESIHCTVCNAIKEGSSRTIGLKEHTYGDWSVTKEATCTAAGTRERTCSVCEDKVTETLPALGHDWDEGTVTMEPSGSRPGIITYRCNTCGTMRSEEMSGTDDSSASGSQKTPTITAANKTMVINSRSANLGAKTNGDGRLIYSSSNKSVATVSSTGVITPRGYGKTTITIKTAETASYKAKAKTITVSVVPKKMTIKKAKSSAKRTMMITWAKDKTVTGYQVMLSMNKNFKKFSVSRNFKAKVTKQKITSLKSKTWYVRMRAYKTVGGKPVYGVWSNVKKVKIK